MLFIECTACNTSVIPKADGHCPSCGAFIASPKPKIPSGTSRDSLAEAPSLPDLPGKPDPLPDSAEEAMPADDFQLYNTGLEPIVIMPNRTAAGLALCMGILFAMGGVMAILSYDDINSKFLILGIVGLLFGPIMLIYSLKKLVSIDPVLVVNDEGIIDNASPACVGLIRWSEITELLVYRQEGISFLGIGVKDPKTVLSRRGGAGGLLARFEAGGDKPAPFGIPQTFLSMPIAELLEEIENRYQVPIRKLD